MEVVARVQLFDGHGADITVLAFGCVRVLMTTSTNYGAATPIEARRWIK
jgi:hypothetical protein